VGDSTADFGFRIADFEFIDRSDHERGEEWKIQNFNSEILLSLDGDTLGEVSRLIDVKAELHRHVVGEEL